MEMDLRTLNLCVVVCGSEEGPVTHISISSTTMAILDLPDELLAQVAIHLSWRDLVHLQQTCTSLFDVVNSTAALQYIIELHVAGRIDNRTSSLVPGERLDILRKKERAWSDVDLSDKKVLPLRHNPSGIYDLTGGVLLLGERRHSEGMPGTESVHTVRLHSAFKDQAASQANRLWSHLDLGKPVIDVGLAVQEHDLIAIVTYSYINEAQLWASIDIHLIKHSTGQPHPAAAKPVLHFDNIHYLPGHSSIMLEVSGDTLCFLLNNYFPFVSADPVTLVIFNWKTGHPKVGQKRLYSDPTMFNSFVLLSPDTVALPIIPSNSIEICNFAQELATPPPPDPPANGGDMASPQPDVPLLKTSCTLELPPLQHGALVLRMTCRCEPNPLGPTTSAANVDTVTPFYSDPEKAIMILHLHMRLTLGTTRVYTMLVHRSSLLKITRDAIASHARARANAESPPSSPASAYVPPSLLFIAAFQPTVHAPNFNPAFEHLSHGDDDNDGDEVVEEPPSVPWAEWGLEHTRWFQDEFPGTRWITTTCGQRFVRVRGDGQLHVYDFNQVAIRRFMHTRAVAGEPVGSRPGEKVVPPEAKEVSPWTGEGEEVEGGLPEFDDDDDDEDDEDLWMAGLEGNTDFGGVELLAPVDGLQDGMGELALLVPDGDEVGVNMGVANWAAATAEADAGQRGKTAVSEASEQQAGPSGHNDTSHPKVLVEVMLGKTVIGPSSAWEDEMESALPYIERSVAISDEYESALVDEDIIVGLKMDPRGRHIKEVILHRIGGFAS